jgi:hypothetical protein
LRLREVVGAKAEELGGLRDLVVGITSRIGRKGGSEIGKGAAFGGHEQRLKKSLQSLANKSRIPLGWSSCQRATQGKAKLWHEKPFEWKFQGMTPLRWSNSPLRS